MSIPYEQQPGESRQQWKERNFARHYGMGDARLRDMGNQHHSVFEQLFANGIPKVGDTFTVNFGTKPSGRMPPPSAGPTYSGRADDWHQGQRRWYADEGESQTEFILNTVENWALLGVELPELILVPTPNDEGVYTITRLEA